MRHGGDHAKSALRWIAPALLGGAAALGGLAVYVDRRAREAERQHPPIGRFMTIDGVRLHYIERGRGDPLVLLHGNGTMIQDFITSGIVDRLAERYRVIVFDRPGFGYSSRPGRLWSPQAQAQLIYRALIHLGVVRAVVLGHSWGTQVALALGLDYPLLVRSLVLASGYYYPTARADVLLLSPPAIPVIGDAMRYTISPLAARLMLPRLIQKMFEPAPVPERFDRQMPKELMLRPSQLQASAEEAALMAPSAMDLQHRYRELAVPAVIITGADDQIADVGRQSERLHDHLPDSEFVSVPGLGHMIHHLAPDEVIEAIDRAAHRSSDGMRRTSRTEGASAYSG
ncbi:alpha/beta fold hydrolase [Microvirga roseola]|uniref:alpha/beta fold hydrolase n=1 Tax=Microvirga roseola TaxID=2883126 RepID=UPI001E5CEE87|nr:alpha/beta hydrolase [Microvirga roseola]